MIQCEQKKQEILRLVGQYYREAFSNEVFVPGETPVRYAGRVFDEEELLNAVDASLDFWLTAGRFAEQFEADLAELFDVDATLLVNSGSSANLIAFSALTSPALGAKVRTCFSISVTER